MTSLEVVQC